MVCPPFTPPPAIHIENPQGLWSRPSPFSLNGVRPNSPPHTTSVSLSIPRALRSASSPAIGLSDARHHLVWCSSTLSCASQPLPYPQYSSSQRTPRSTSPRPSRQSS